MTLAQSEEKNFLKRLTEITEANLSNERFGVSELAREMGMSHSNLHRKVKKVYGSSISLFIRHVRLKKALEFLKLSSSTVSEVAFECGFHSVSYFTKCFHDHFGYPPGQAGKIETEGQNPKEFLQHSNYPYKPRRRFTIVILLSVILILLVVISLIIVIKPFTASNQIPDKSIAVLPFINDSPDEAEMWFINGTMDAILNNLSKIEDLRVPGRTSVEQYRNNPKSISEIAKELNVSFILEGSGIKHGNNIRLTLQLVDAVNDSHVWSKTYNRKILKPEELFALTSEIAQLVAAQIKAEIKPEEKQRIENIPTKNIEAYAFYQKGRDNYTVLWQTCRDSEALERASDFYYEALEHDSTFAQAYIGLARVCWDEHFLSDRFSGAFLDTVLILTERALSFDDQLADAFLLRGNCFDVKGLRTQAIKEYDRAIKINPTNWAAYGSKGVVYLELDLVNAIDNLHKAANLIGGSELPELYQAISWAYTSAGFLEKAEYYQEESLKLGIDSVWYYTGFGWIEFYLNNSEKAIGVLHKAINRDSTHSKALEFLAECYLMSGQYEESLTYFRKWFESINSSVQFNLLKTSWLGYAYWKNGYKEEAEYYFDAVRDNWYRAYELGHGWERIGTHYVIAGILAFNGEKDKAIEHLRTYGQNKLISFWWLFYINNDPLFDNIRDDPEFKQIIRDLESKYLAEHERVRKWLEDQGML